VRVGIIGCGRIGARHLDAYQKIGDVQVVVSDENEAATKGLAELPGVRAAAPDDLLDMEIDALDVCVPSFAHRAWILAGLQRGLHVFCEKPLCLNHRDAREIHDTAVAAQRNVVVGYLYRHHPAFRFMKQVIEDRVIGNPHLALARLGGRGSHQPWKHDAAGGGVAFEMMVHMLDLTEWILGPLGNGHLLHHELILPARQINGEMHRVNAPDCAVAVFEAGGVRAICQSDLATPSFMNYVEIHGDNGSVTGSILDSMPTMVYCNEPRGMFDRGHNRQRIEPVNLFVKELGEFVETVAAGRFDPAPLKESVELAEFVDSLIGV
jgi:predicted dehydrogenase